MDERRISMWVGDVFREFVDGVLRREFPKKSGLCRSWYANGQLESESTFGDGGMEGIAREWYANGVLKKEEPCRRGKVHGTVRQWNSQGTLLGEYEMVNGAGTIKRWREDGSLESEMELFTDGCAKAIDYDEETGRARETYLWDGKPVSRKKFLQKLEKWRAENAND